MKVIQNCYIGAQDPKNDNKIKIIKINPKKECDKKFAGDLFENIDMSSYAKTLDIKKQHWGKELILKIFKRGTNDAYLG